MKIGKPRVDPLNNRIFERCSNSASYARYPILIRVSERKTHKAAPAKFNGAGPLRMRPDVSYSEPWHGQNQPLYSPRTSPAFLSLRDTAEMRADTDDNQPLRFLYAVSVGLFIAERRQHQRRQLLKFLRGVRRRMNTGLPCQTTVIRLPNLNGCQIDFDCR